MSRFNFRAWDKRIGQFTRSGIQFVNSDMELEVFEPLILMQFTGLTDKNGVGIFEGDILSTVVTVASVGPFIVKWNARRAKFKCETTALYIPPEQWSEREVIGNIYENPELLEAK